MLGNKKLFLSKTLWGAVLVLVGSIFKELEINISQEELQTFGSLIVQLIGLSVVFYGRITATKVLK